MQSLIDSIARTKFGSQYVPARGILHPRRCPTALQADFAGLEDRQLQNPHVRFFLAQNPGYARGEELVCLCELSHQNLRPWARAQFEKGQSG